MEGAGGVGNRVDKGAGAGQERATEEWTMEERCVPEDKKLLRGRLWCRWERKTGVERDSKTPGGAGGLRVVQLSLSKWMPAFLRASSRNSATSTASREQAAYSSFEASGSVI